MRPAGFLISLVLFLSCKQNTSADKPVEALMDSVYSIEGIVVGADSGALAILEFLGTGKKPDTAVIAGNRFQFKGSANDPLVADLYIQQQSHSPAKPLKIIVENTVINVEGKADSISDANVIAGISNKDFITLKKSLRLVEDSMEFIGLSADEANLRKDSAALQNLHNRYTSFSTEKTRLIKQFALEHPKNIGGAYYVTTEYDYNIAQLDSIYNGFDSTIKNNLYVKQIKEIIDATKRTAVGQLAPDFELKSLDGKQVSLSSFKEKYLFVDFWASWCAPCRAENPHIVKAWQKFKGNDFQILGVSLDEEKQDWISAIKKDKLTWQHVSDLKRWQSSVVPLYGIRAIPTNVLIDKEGKIIARDLHGGQLQKKLEKIFKTL